jgi:hypothetical protein
MKDQKKKILKERENFLSLLQKTKDGPTRQRLLSKLAALDAKLQEPDASEPVPPPPPTLTPLSRFDARPLDSLPTQPDAQTLYVAPTAAQAAELDAAGYPALWLDPPGPDAVLQLAGFAGTDIVLTHPDLHALASSLDADRFAVVCADCWPGGVLNVVDTVPMMTHLLTLAERHDVIPIQSSGRGRLAQKLYKAFELGNAAAYRKMAREVVGA